MKRTIATCLLAVLLCCVCPLPANPAPRSDKDAQKAAEQIKTAIQKLGSGPAAYIELKLNDGTKLKGYVDSSTEDHFVVVDAKTGQSKDVLYGQVKHVKGNNLSTGAKIAIGVGVGLVILILVFKKHIDAY